MLVIISGLPGTGKTTLAAALAKRLNFLHLNSDMIREEMGKKGRYDPQTKALIYRTMQDRAEDHLQRGEDVIVDATFYKESLREVYLRLAHRLQVPLRWIELEAGEAAIRRRVSRQRDHSEADFDVYQKIKKAYEPLSVPHLVLSSDEMSLSETLDRASDYLQQPT